LIDDAIAIIYENSLGCQVDDNS